MRLLLLLLLITFPAFAGGPKHDFKFAKKFLAKHLELFDSSTIYCGCKIQANLVDLKSCGYKIQSDPKRAARLEWEHVVPAEAFGQSFKEWREGDPKCQKHGKPFKGRKCAEKNEEFKPAEIVTMALNRKFQFHYCPR